MQYRNCVCEQLFVSDTEDKYFDGSANADLLMIENLVENAPLNPVCPMVVKIQCITL